MKLRVFALNICILLLATSCSFLPRETEPLPAPVVLPYEMRNITLAAAARDDLILTRSISAQYRPFIQQSYSFAVSGVPLKGVYVNVGDTVKKGDLLAELDRRELLAKIDEAKIDIQKQQRLLEHAKASISVEREQFVLDDLRSQLKVITENALAKGVEVPYSEKSKLTEGIAKQEITLSDAKAAHEAAVRFAEDQVNIAVQRLASLEELSAERAIYSLIDGTVTQVKILPTNYRSIDGTEILTVSDAAEAIYVVTGADAELFTPGEIYSIKLGDDNCNALAALPDESAQSTGTPSIYLFPQDIITNLTTYGTVVIELDRREDALYLPGRAIRDSGGRDVVYYLDENGLRAVKPVETGLRVGGRVEILSGVSEGEEFIVE